MILVILPDSIRPDLSMKLSHLTIRRLSEENMIREAMCVSSTPKDDDVCSSIIARCRGLGPKITKMVLEEAVEKLPIYREVYLLPIGMKTAIASIAYNLGRSSTPTKLVIVTSSGKLIIMSIKTLRKIVTL